MADFSNCSRLIFWCRRAKGLCSALRMGVDRELRKVRVLPAVLMHVAAHDQGIYANKRNTLFHLIICIRGRGQGGPWPAWGVE